MFQRSFPPQIHARSGKCNLLSIKDKYTTLKSFSFFFSPFFIFRIFLYLKMFSVPPLPQVHVKSGKCMAVVEDKVTLLPCGEGDPPPHQWVLREEDWTKIAYL